MTLASFGQHLIDGAIVNLGSVARGRRRHARPRCTSRVTVQR
jgi:hypothetical protein